MAVAFRINVYNIIKINVVLLDAGMHMQLQVCSSYFVSEASERGFYLARFGGGLFIIHILFGF